jgi:glc operon protein GlcG
MYSRQFVGLEEARAVGEAALAKALEDPDRPVAIAVVDPMGELVYFVRQDNSLSLTTNMAINKAYTAAFFRGNTTDLAEAFESRGRKASDFLDPRFTAIEGGVCLKAADGAVIGAIGASGRSPMDKVRDHDLAEAGAKALSR